MPEEITDAAASAAPAASSAGKGALGALKGLFGKSGGGLGSVIKMAGGGKAIIPIAGALLLLGGATFFIISAVAVYASRLGAVPGYAGAWAGGKVTCPDTSGWGAPDVVSVPDISGAQLTEKIDAEFTGYYPATSTTTSNSTIEGSAYGAFNDIHLGIGAAAVPKNSTRFPLGRTVLDIPGVGLRVAVDVGGNIRERKDIDPKGWKYDHFDIFVGWGSEGAKAVAKIPGEPMDDGTHIGGVKIYVFPSSDEMMKNLVKSYSTQQECINANAAGAFAGGSGNALAVAQSQLGNNDYNRYNGHEAAWCADFVSWVYKEAGFSVSQIPVPSKIRDYFKKNMIWIDNPSISQIQPGDVIYFDIVSANRRGSGTHIGIVESVDGQIINTIEGNTGRRSSPDNKSLVKRQVHRLSDSDPHIQGVGRAK